MSVDKVFSINGRHWPAWEREDDLLIDFRLFGNEGDVLIYDAKRLMDLGTPDFLIKAAAESRPAGLVLLTEETLTALLKNEPVTAS